MKRIILDLCGGTGSWSKPYRDAGFEVHVITLPDYDVTLWGHRDGLLNFTNLKTYDHIQIPIKDIYGILAAPPCTQFSFARQRYKTPPNFREAMKVVNACLEIVQEVQYQQGGKLGFWALENPVGHLRKFLGRPQYTFKQWEFGGYHVKPTDVWGFFNDPRPTHRKKPSHSRDELMKRWTNPKIPAEFTHLPTLGERRAAVRAITPAGFAKTFFKANS